MKRLRENQDDLASEFFAAISDGRFTQAKSLILQNAILLSSINFSNQTPLMAALLSTHEKSVSYAEVIAFCIFLLDECHVDPDEILGGDYTALQSAINQGVIEIVELLLERGANPNLGRTLFSAIRDERRNGAKCIAALIKHGVDVNKVFAMFGDRKNAKTALDFTVNPEFKAMLIAAGAKTAAQVLKENPETVIDGADK
jgi:ankyrin repeat protein